MDVSKIMLDLIQKYPAEKKVGVAQAPSWKIQTAAKVANVHVNTLRNWIKAKIGVPIYQKTPNAPIYFPIRQFIEWDLKRNAA